MKIALLTVQVPFIRGGAEVLADQLKIQLLKGGHQVEIVSMPFKWYPNQNLYECMLAGRMIDISEAAYEKVDLMIGLKFPAYYAKNSNQVLWLVHQHRQAYDLYETKFSDMHTSKEGRKLREFILETDNRMLSNYKSRYTISQNVANRLKKFNNLESEALYHPPQDHDQLYCDASEDYIFYPSRIDFMKRQRLLIESARHMQSNLKIKIAGTGNSVEVKHLQTMVKDFGLEKRVELLGLVSQKQKIDLLANCRAVFFGCYDEDYGYVTLEAMFSKKPVIVFSDAGGPTEFIQEGINGFVVRPNAKDLAAKLDELSEDKNKAIAMGENAYASMLAKNISWENVLEKLLRST